MTKGLALSNDHPTHLPPVASSHDDIDPIVDFDLGGESFNELQSWLDCCILGGELSSGQEDVLSPSSAQ